MRRADEKPPEDHWKKRFPELEKKLLDAYYKFKGWNSDGIPTRETLHELDLDYVAEDPGAGDPERTRPGGETATG